MTKSLSLPEQISQKTSYILPNTLILGAPKSGSTWLYDNLKGHPQIASPRKEIHYFNNNSHQSLEWYSQFFADAHKGEPIILDAGSNYLYVYDHLGAYFEYNREVPRAIQATLGNPKMILIFRDPIDRLYSNYINMMQGVIEYGGIYRGHVKHFTPEEAKAWNLSFNATWIRDFKKQVLNFLVPDTLEKTLLTHPTLIERGFYDVHLRRYLEVFPRENFLFLEFEMLKANPIELIYRICDFLEIEHWYDEKIIHDKSNRAEKRALPRSWYWHAWLAKQLRKGHFKPLIKRLMLLNEQLGNKPELSDDLANVLATWYQPHNRELALLTDLDLNHWRSPQ